VACTSEDPSPWTAQGVFAGIGAALDAAGVELVGARVVVQGVGHVGADLARRLTGAGCSVAVADVDPVRAAAVAEEIDGRVVDPRAAITSPCDVLAPCAAPRVIDRRVVDALECRVVAGAANDILATPDVAGRLARRHIVYVPDFVINAGGVLHIHALREGWGPEKLEESVRAIGDRVARILREADRSGRSPVTAAEEMAAHRLGRPIALPS
jgi:leucine dehydrogenase